MAEAGWGVWDVIHIVSNPIFFLNAVSAVSAQATLTTSTTPKTRHGSINLKLGRLIQLASSFLLVCVILRCGVALLCCAVVWYCLQC